MIPIADRVAAVDSALDRFSARAFRYGSADCITFARHVVTQATGVNPIKGLSWRGRASALEVVSERAGNLSACLDGIFERISPASAIVADLIGMPHQADGFDVGVGVFDGQSVVCWHGGRLTRMPTDGALAAWRLA